MKRILLALALGLLPGGALLAIPNSVGGDLLGANSPLNGQDLTDPVLAAATWDGSAALPGEWVDEGQVAASSITYLRARPKLFGKDLVLLRAVRREGKLDSLEATFVDAGSYFGYFDEKLPEGMSPREARKEVDARLAEKQASFTKLYTDSQSELRNAIGVLCGGVKPEEVTIGRTRGLKVAVQEWKKGDLRIRLLAGENRLLRVNILNKGAGEADQWLDPAVAALPPREKLEKLAAEVRKEDDGTVVIQGLQPVAQGYRPYCGLNSLAMAARHFGLHLDEDWLAYASGFKNTGRADGSNLVKLYHTVAAEAGLGLDRSTKFDPSAVSRALSAGFPVIVWRRYSPERNNLHNKFMRDFARDHSATLPNPADAAERSSWPTADAPLHASVIVGYNSARKEILFLESWTGKDKPRRMRVEEMTATTDLCFVFKP